MEQRNFGNTSLQVSALGFGAMHINDGRVSEAEAGRLLNLVLDRGVTLLDTARGYGLSEQRIGRHLAHRRGEFVLSTKLGYGVEGQEDWTYGCIRSGVEDALQRLRTDVLDIAHLHSCPLEILRRGEVIQALEDCRCAGKVRVVAYSGDNAELDFAIEDGRFGAIQTSISICDQVSIPGRLPAMALRGLGVIAKRPVAGSVWSSATKPEAHAEGIYWNRWHSLALPDFGLDRNELALRFCAFLPGVASCIVGTGKPENLARNLAALAKGPLPQEHTAAIRAAFDRLGGDWPSLI